MQAPWTWNVEYAPRSSQISEHWKFRARVPGISSASCTLEVQESKLYLAACSRHYPRDPKAITEKLEHASMCAHGNFIAFSERYCICWLGSLEMKSWIINNLEASIIAFVGCCINELQEADSMLDRIVHEESFLSGVTAMFAQSPEHPM